MLNDVVTRLNNILVQSAPKILRKTSQVRVEKKSTKKNITHQIFELPTFAYNLNIFFSTYIIHLR